MAPRKRAAEVDDGSQIETRSAKARRTSKQGKDTAVPTQAQSKKGNATEKATGQVRRKANGKAKAKAKAKGKENENPSFSWRKDVKGTEYEGRTMTLGPGEWDSEDDLVIGRADSESQDDLSDLVSDEAVESDATGPRGEGEDAAVESDKENEDGLDKHKAPMDKKDPYEYILMQRPLHDYETENDNMPEDSKRDDEELEDLCEIEGKKIPHDTAASTMPDHKWVLMRGAWIKFADSMRERTYRSPDAFNMYIYNDFEGYGILELVENHVQAFATEYAKKNPNLKEMWMSLVGLIHFLLIGDIMPMGLIDDGERLGKFITLIGRAYLTMLNSLDRADQLKSDSDFKDLALVSGLYMLLPGHFVDSYDDDVLDWKTYIGDYMETRKIDSTFVHGSPELDMDGEVDEFDGRDGIPKPGVDRWGFKNALRKYKANYGTNGNLIGGKQHDITKMSRSERARYAFDKKDPLKGFSDKQLKEGVLMLQ